MAGLFGDGGRSAPPRKDNSEIQREASAERRRRALAVGRSSTILGGLTDERTGTPNRPQLGGKTLLGE